jgi:hypothetical protein
MATKVITTGMERSLCVRISKDINGEPAPGYPFTYNGMDAFSYSGKNYGQMSPEQIAIMKPADFQTRLADFKAWVMEMEIGLDFNRDGEGSPYRENLTACPIAVSSI